MDSQPSFSDAKNGSQHPVERRQGITDYLSGRRGAYMPVSHEESDAELQDLTRTGTPSGSSSPTTSQPTIASTPRSKRGWKLYCLYGTACSMIVLIVAGLIQLSISVIRGSDKGEPDPDAIFADWGKPGTGTEEKAWYPTDLLRDVVPIHCHSHNDYWRKVPLFSALHAGCIGVEADVWLFENDEKLYVGHDTAALTSARTFETLYIEPLVELLNRTNPATEFYNESRRGVFDFEPKQSLVLLVDVKTDGAKTWPVVLKQLEPLRERGWLTFVDSDIVNDRPITVVGTGNTPFDLIQKGSSPRDAFFDAPLDKMWEDPDSSAPIGGGTPYIQTNSYYASTSLTDSVGNIGADFSEEQLRVIRGQVKGARRRGLKARYWETPAWPIKLRNMVWNTLMREGVDLLNVDDLQAASKHEW